MNICRKNCGTDSQTCEKWIYRYKVGVRFHNEINEYRRIDCVSESELCLTNLLNTHTKQTKQFQFCFLDNIDAVEKRIRLLFSQCARGELAGAQSDVEFNTVRKEYYKILEDADEKVQLANLMYDLVDRYLRRLDSELFKFKCELEADHNGITEILEKRSLELDGGMTNPLLNAGSGNAGNNIGSGGSSSSNSNLGGSHGSQKENRFFGMISANNHTQGIRRSKPEKRRNSSTGSNAPPEKRPAISNNVPVPSTPINVMPPASPAISLPPATPTNLQSGIIP